MKNYHEISDIKFEGGVLVITIDGELKGFQFLKYIRLSNFLFLHRLLVIVARSLSFALYAG